MQKGVARGIFSNEAGLGSAPIAAAAAQTEEPVALGLYAIIASVSNAACDKFGLCSLLS